MSRRRRWGALAAMPLLLFLLAACGGGPSDQQQEELTLELQELEGLADELVLDLSRIGPSRAQFLPDPPARMVTVQLLAEAVSAAIPGEFKFYLAAAEAQDLFTTVSVPRGERVPKGDELVDGVAFVEPGVFYTITIVYENPTDEDVNFLVTAPTLDPQAALPFARARCWCAAVPFNAPAGGAFYRTIQVGVGPDTPPGAKAIVVWPVVSLDQFGGGS